MKLIIALLLLLPVLLVGCKKDKPPVQPLETTPTTTATTHYILVCNEGQFNTGNASVSRIETNGTCTVDMYKAANNKPLGDIAQSIIAIDNKYYIAVNNSGKIEVVNTSDFKNIATIQGLISPRYILPIGNNRAYVSNFKLTNTLNYIQVINTQTNVIIDSIALNGWSEKMVLIGTKAYVTNGSNKYVYVINTLTNAIDTTIELTNAVTDIVKDNSNNMWVLCGDYDSHPNYIAYINTTTNAVDQTINFVNNSDFLHIAYNSVNNTLFLLDKNIYALNKTSNTLEKVVNKGTHSFYNFGIDVTNQQLIVSDTKDFQQQGYIYRYALTNYALLDSCKVGIGPSEIFVKE